MFSFADKVAFSLDFDQLVGGRVRGALCGHGVVWGKYDPWPALTRKANSALHPRAIDSETVGVWPRGLYFNKSFRWLWWLAYSSQLAESIWGAKQARWAGIWLQDPKYQTLELGYFPGTIESLLKVLKWESFIHSFSQYLLSTYHVPGLTLGTEIQQETYPH